MGDTMPATRPSQLLTLQSFGDISRFLREGVADEDSRQLRDSLGVLSMQIDEAVRTRRTSTDTTDSAIYYYARSLVPNEDNVLHIGMTTENTITINQAEKVLAVPKLAVKQRGGKQYVRVLGENNQPQEKEIITGLSDNMSTEVKSGLSEGENVIISEAAAGETSNSVGRGIGRPPM